MKDAQSARLRREMRQRQQLSEFNRLVTHALVGKVTELHASEMRESHERTANPSASTVGFFPSLSTASGSQLRAPNSSILSFSSDLYGDDGDGAI